jgi:hypothetical protein
VSLLNYAKCGISLFLFSFFLFFFWYFVHRDFNCINYRYADFPQAFELSAQSMHLHKSLVRMGFQPRDVDRALTFVATLADAMDWLCLNASEENLPKKFAPTKGNIQVMVFAKPGGDRGNAAIEEAKQVDAMEGLDDRRKALAVGVMEWGFLGGECAVVLPKLRDEELAAAHAEEYVLREMFDAVFRGEKSVNEDTIDRASLEELRSEELVVLESIFGSDYEKYLFIICPCVI